MKVVVTGALGHIGSRLIRALPDAFPGSDIVLLDNLSTQRMCSLFDLPVHGRYRFLEADVLDADLVPPFAGADAVVHLAAITDAANSFRNRDQVERVNVDGTERVARACLQTNSPLVFLSTTSVYGTQTGTVDEDCPASDLKPQSPYAESKLAMEVRLRTLGETENLAFVTLRLGTIFGTSIGMRFHTAVNKFCWQAALGQPITVWRTAMNQHRPYLDLGDAVNAILFVIRRSLFNRGLYNVVTNNATVKDIIDLISKHLGVGPSIQTVDSEIMNQLSYHVSSSRFRSLGFEFHGSLDRGIGETLALLRAVAGGERKTGQGG